MTTLLLNDLREMVAAKQAVVFVGSGISVGATEGAAAASWVGLLRTGVERCRELHLVGDDWCARVKAEIDSSDVDDLISAAEKVSKKLKAPDGPEYGRWLEDTIGKLKPAKRAVIEALRNLDIPLITTNYDDLIEDVTGLPSVTWREPRRVEKILRNDEKAVVHLHGHWRAPGSVILGIRSYESVLQDEHTQAILRAIRTMKTLIFVGFGGGLDDPNFGALRAWSRKALSGGHQRHYRLALEREVPELRAKHADEERVFVLPYGKHHDELETFLHSIGGSVAVGGGGSANPS